MGIVKEQMELTVTSRCYIGGSKLYGIGESLIYFRMACGTLPLYIIETYEAQQ
jgi:hypothetical protein